MEDRIEPTMEEIVVALRETRRDAGRMPPLSVVSSRSETDRAPYAVQTDAGRAVARDQADTTNPDQDIPSANVTDLRDAEIDRLLADNARCNERIMFLLKVLERERRRNAIANGEGIGTDADRAAIMRDVKASLDAELRPVLLVLHRLLEKQQQRRPGEDSPAKLSLKAPSKPSSMQPSGWIADMARKLGSPDEAQDWKTSPALGGALRLPTLRQRLSRAFHALRA